MTGPELSYSVAAVRPGDVRTELCRLWSRNLTTEQPADAKFDWLFSEAPHPSDVVFVLKAKDADGEERVVGTNGMVVRQFIVSGQPALVAVSADLAVDRDHRRLWPALALLKAWREHAASRFDVAYGFPNDKARAVLLRAGFRELGRTTRYVRVLRLALYAERLRARAGSSGVVAWALSRPWTLRASIRAVDAMRLLLLLPACVRAAARYRLSWRDDPDPRCDDLFERCRPAEGVVGVRSHAFLSWRCPGARVACVDRRADGALVAHAVIERDGATGAHHIRDLFGCPEALGPALDLIVPALAHVGADSVSMRFLGAPAMARLLLSRGFAPRPDGGRTVVVDHGMRLEGHADVLTNRDCWRLFDVDEDA